MQQPRCAGCVGRVQTLYCERDQKVVHATHQMLDQSQRPRPHVGPHVAMAPTRPTGQIPTPYCGGGISQLCCQAIKHHFWRPGFLYMKLLNYFVTLIATQKWFILKKAAKNQTPPQSKDIQTYLTAAYNNPTVIFTVFPLISVYGLGVSKIACQAR